LPLYGLSLDYGPSKYLEKVDCSIALSGALLMTKSFADPVQLDEALV
jgi:hypothetical protein